MTPLAQSRGADQTLSANVEIDAIGTQITLQPLPTKNQFFFVVGSAAVSRPSGTTPVNVAARLAVSTAKGATTVFGGAPRGLTMLDTGGADVKDSVQAIAMVEVPAGTAAYTVAFKIVADGAGVTVLGSTSQGTPVTTLLGFLVP